MTKEAKEVHPKAKEALAKKLEDELSTCLLKNGHPNLEPKSEWGWTFSAEASKQRSEWWTTGDAWSFLYRKISDQFDGVPYDKLPSGYLKNIIEPGKYESLTNEILDFVYSLPRKYSFYLRLLKSNDAMPLPLTLGPDISVIEISKGDPVSGLTIGWKDDDPMFRRILASLEKDTDEKKVFQEAQQVLCIRANGYNRGRQDDSAAAKAIAVGKVLLFLGEVGGIFKRDSTQSPWGKYLPEMVFVDETSCSQEAQKVELPEDIAELFGEFQIASEDKTFFSRQKMHLSSLAKLLSAHEQDKNKAPIVTAAQWGFESAATRNQTISFIQLCIALEAILGDDELKEGITKTLADRCAFLIGKTTTDRAIYRKKFSTLYDHRSKLVHGRKVTLSKEGAESLRWGTNVLEFVLRHELSNFHTDKED